MPNPVPAPSPVNWGYEELRYEPDLPSTSWEYSVWVYWSNKGVTSRIVNIPRPADGADVEVNSEFGTPSTP